MQSANAAVAASRATIVQTLNAQFDEMAAVLNALLAGTRTLRPTPANPGLGMVLATRALGEFGNDPHRYTDAKARKNYAGTSPIIRASGKEEARAHPLRRQPQTQFIL